MGRTDSITKQMVKRLQAEIDKAADPQTVISLTRLMDQVLTRVDKSERKSKPVEKPAEEPKRKKRSLREIYTGSVYKAMSDEQLVIEHLVLLIESKRRDKYRELGRELTETENEEVKKSVLEEYEQLEQA